MNARRFPRICPKPAWLVLLAMPFASGCSAGKPQQKISGVVLLDGKPLPGGLVTFRPEDSTVNSETIELGEDGRFEVNLPEGKVQVTVDNRHLAPPPPATSTGAGTMPAGLAPDIVAKLRGNAPAGPRPAPAPRPGSNRYRPLPEKYFLLETSGLDFVVKRGDEKHDLQLKSAP